jgi:hypothetical protein
MSRLHGSGRLEGVMTLSGANSPPTTCTLPLPQIHRQPTFFKKTNRNLNGTNPNPPASAAANTTDERQPATVSGCGCASALFFYFFFTKKPNQPEPSHPGRRAACQRLQRASRRADERRPPTISSASRSADV